MTVLEAIGWAFMSPTNRREHRQMEEARQRWHQVHVGKRIQALPSVSHRATFAARDAGGRFTKSPGLGERPPS